MEVNAELHAPVILFKHLPMKVWRGHGDEAPCTRAVWKVRGLAAVHRHYAELGITAAHCCQYTNFSNGPRILIHSTSWRLMLNCMLHLLYPPPMDMRPGGPYSQSGW